MADTFTFYTKYKEALANGSGVDLNAGAVKVALFNATYTPDQDADEFYDDISGELDASGDYTAEGVALVSPTISTASHNIKFDATDLPTLDFTGWFFRKDKPTTTWTNKTKPSSIWTYKDKN